MIIVTICNLWSDKKICFPLQRIFFTSDIFIIIQNTVTLSLQLVIRKLAENLFQFHNYKNAFFYFRIIRRDYLEKICL